MMRQVYSSPFTWDAFAPANRVFVDIIREREPERRHRVFFVIDQHVATAHPTLPAEIETFSDVLQLFAPRATGRWRSASKRNWRW